MERRSLAEMAAIPGVGDAVASNLFQMGWRNLRDLAIADADELAQVPGIGSTERAESIIEVANDAASGKLQLAVKYPEPASEENRMVVDPNEDEGYAGGDA